MPDNGSVTLRDTIYMRLVQAAGLYGYAFFGWHAPLRVRRSLDALWRIAGDLSVA